MKVNDTEKEYVLDLNNFPYDEHELKITSARGDGKFLPWGVELVTNPNIVVEPLSNDTLLINLDSEALMTDERIVLSNYDKEKVRIHIIHNDYVAQPKSYTFRVSKQSVDGRKTRIRIISKENKAETGWECTYKGSPLSYDIKPLKSTRSGYVDIELKSRLFTNVKSMIEFTQNGSENKIRLVLNQSNDNTEIIRAD